VAELKADETRATGCGYDKDLIWTSDACRDDAGAPGFSATFGAAFAGDATPCQSASPAAEASTAVRCCADAEEPAGPPVPSPTKAPTPATIASASSCDDLGWPNAANYGSPLVCGESDLGLGGCSGLMDWVDARDHCEAAGARLCSVAELEADETRATGCGYDKESVWASDACDASGGTGSNGRMFTAGGSNKASEGSTACHADALTDTAAARPARCCADVAVSSGVAVVPAITHVSKGPASSAPKAKDVSPGSSSGSGLLSYFRKYKPQR
jgi:hypothetical protein